MKLSIILISLFLCGIFMPPGQATAADVNASPYSAQREPLPFPRSERAQSVLASGVCWSDCGAHCAWGMAGCLTHDAQGECLKLTDACDRYCQRECRSSGGPLLPIDLFWE
jgi:hypothetical protein